jgi:CheY-like chemotaxis protein
MPGTVLIVEDNRWHRKIYTAVLKAHDYRPIEIIDPKAALIAARHSQPVLLLIDILLPGMDGRALIGQFRADSTTLHIPIIAVSAAADPEMAETCLAVGADRFRAKPLPLLTLVDDIEALIVRA